MIWGDIIEGTLVRGWVWVDFEEGWPRLLHTLRGRFDLFSPGHPASTDYLGLFNRIHHRRFSRQQSVAVVVTCIALGVGYLA